ncbi:MAG: SigE family RNA polymerase sigma factor [Mycobacteriales bacterium]
MRVHRRSDEEFAAFARSAYDDLLRVGYLLTGNRADAEDLLQTALLNTYLRWRHVRDVDAARAYVRAAMVHSLATARRRRWRDEVPVAKVPEQESRTSPGPADVDNWVSLIAALQRIPARQRAAVVLRHYLGMSEKGAAEALKLSVPAVKSLTARGLMSLREQEATPTSRPPHDSRTTGGTS